MTDTSSSTTATGRKVTVIVNTQPHSVDKGELTFEEIVHLAFGGQPGGENIAFTVTHRRGHGNKPSGSLVEGESVRVKEDMIFNVTRTDKS